MKKLLLILMLFVNINRDINAFPGEDQIKGIVDKALGGVKNELGDVKVKFTDIFHKIESIITRVTDIEKDLKTLKEAGNFISKLKKKIPFFEKK